MPQSECPSPALGEGLPLPRTSEELQEELPQEVPLAHGSAFCEKYAPMIKKNKTRSEHYSIKHSLWSLGEKQKDKVEFTDLLHTETVLRDMLKISG